MRRDPIFRISDHDIGAEPEAEDTSPIQQGPVRVVPSQSELADPLSEPVEERAETRVIQADVDPSRNAEATPQPTVIEPVNECIVQPGAEIADSHEDIREE